VLYGTRAATPQNWRRFVGQDMIEGLLDRVSSDDFLGAPVGCSLIERYSATPKQLYDGSLVYEVQVPVEQRSVQWNLSYRENATNTGPEFVDMFDTVEIGGDDKNPGHEIYQSAAFAPLLD
jgi:hypothetical protein